MNNENRPPTRLDPTAPPPAAVDPLAAPANAPLGGPAMPAPTQAASPGQIPDQPAWTPPGAAAPGAAAAPAGYESAAPVGYPGWESTVPATDPYSAPTSGYPGATQPGDQPQAYPSAGYSSAPGYPGAGYPGPGYGGGYAAVPATPKTNTLAIVSMVVSIVGGTLLFCYGVGLLPGLAGAIMGHVARRQVRERSESGGAMALAGVIIGWIVFVVGLLIAATIIALLVWAANNPDFNAEYSSRY